ncbi:ATP-dependent DNA helicase DDX11 isoform X2 [Strongylocentrotus purpuratus]|uniref:Helicase ATP-binding domain-containing protein n=1 Tax=Strongylocentrotus purpuratus TaxID=7668 RepID=A0A7M7NMQ4_STRPU|nr:ATP-dependent DNA helicase DDX11 isoform X2 [Strongylocentrotus purpuratus]
MNESERKTDMEEKQDEGEGPVKFPFPFPPYPIQEDFMKHLYEALDGGKIGIFESPTGTGKSLSLICGALKWLTDHEKQKQVELEALMEQQQSEAHEQSNGTTQSSGAPDWVMEFESKRDQMEKTTKLMEEREKKLKREAKLDKLKNDLRQRSSFKRKRLSTTDETVGLDKELDDKDKRQGAGDAPPGEEDDVDDHLVADYHSDGDSAESEEDEEKDEIDEPEEITKIFYCSRTHSQLSQFVHEVQKSPYHDDVKVVTLGSRQNLCINEAVKKLRSMTLINDRCLEMQSKKKPAKKDDDSTTKPKRKRSKQSLKACPHFSQGQLSLYKDRVAVEVMDMEQLGKVGKELKACPYYGTRYAVPNAQLVVLPYNILLHKSTRKACRINLKGNIVIIDEAHNLIETICNVHSVEVTGAQLCRAHSQLSQYMQKFKSRLLAKNLMYIKQLLQILSSWVRQLGGRTDSAPDSQKLSGSGSTSVFTINNFLFETQMDNINLFKLQRYCQKSQISRKLNGFVERYQPLSVKVHQPEKPKGSGMTQFLHQISKRDQAPSQNQPPTPDKSGDDETHVFSSPLMHIEGFLLALTNANKDGRVVVNKKELVSQCSLRFQLLNPAVHFTDVVKEARAIIVAGGTMQPVEDFKHQLFVCTGVQPERILEFSCGHVIPPEHLLPISLSKGPTGLELDFTYQHRDLPQMMDEVGRILVNISNIVPGGVVCFFPSYDYEKQIYQYWESHGVLTRLGHRKKIYREPRKANQVDQVLGQYSATIEKACSGCTLSGLNGAMLFCVVGGKMSEGINFSDNLGRCIVMVGLPYANIKSPELKEKMDYLNANMPQINGRSAGQVHYDNLCMKAVNQSIGRAIRHKGDYASMLLLDHRYTRPSIRSKLPAWISERLQVASRFGPAFASINKFFVDKRPDKLE